MIEPLKPLQPVGQEISSIGGILDLSRIELRRIVQRLQEQVAELQKENQELRRRLLHFEDGPFG